MGESAPAVRRQRRPRAQGRLSQRAGIGFALIVAASATSAALLADASPTGLTLLDALYRAAAAALISIAASRARRWALVIAALLVGVFGSGWWVVSGYASMVAIAALVWVNRRDRLAGAAIGGLTALGLLHLDVGWFPRAESVVGVTAGFLVLLAGWRQRRRGTRRPILITVSAAAGFVALSVALVGFAAWSARADLEEAVAAIEDGVRLVRDGEADAAVARLDAASAAFGRADDTVGAPWLLPARIVPVLGQNLGAVQAVVGEGAALTGAAATSARDVDYDRVTRPDGGLDLSVIQSFRDPVVDTADALRSARRAVANSRSGWLVPAISSRLDTFDRELDRLGREAELAELAVIDGPRLLGAEGKRRYLVLLGNPAEARDMGGHIGNWVELEVDDGRFSLGEVGGPLDLADPTSAGIQNADRYPVSYVEMRPAQFPQNWGATPDLPTAALLAAELYRYETGRRIDGLMYADPRTFAAFVELSGPVDVPGLDGVRLTGENTAQFLLVDQFNRFPDDTSADEALRSVIRIVFERLTSAPLPGPRRLGELYGPLVRGGRLQLASLWDDDDAILDRMGLRGEVPSPEESDLIGVLTRNANPSKIDAYLHRSTAVQVNWDPRSGEVTSTVAVTLRNDPPAGPNPRTVDGNALGLPAGTNVTDLAVLTPFELVGVRTDDVDLDPVPQFEGDRWRHSVRVVLAPGATTTVTFALRGFVRAGPRYRIDVVGQPLANDDQMEIDVFPMVGRVRSSGPIEAVETGGSVSVSGSDDLRFVFGLQAT